MLMATVDSHIITCSLNTANSGKKLEGGLNLLQIPLLCSSLHKFSSLISNQPTLSHNLSCKYIKSICSCSANETIEQASHWDNCEGWEKARVRTPKFKKWKKEANWHAGFLKLDLWSKNLSLLYCQEERSSVGCHTCPEKRQALLYWNDF